MDMVVQVNKPKVVIYTTTGCEACDMMIGKIKEANQAIYDTYSSEKGDVVVSVINVINPKDLKSRVNKIYDFPTIEFVNNKDVIVDTIVGLSTYDRVCNAILKII